MRTTTHLAAFPYSELQHGMHGRRTCSDFSQTRERVGKRAMKHRKGPLDTLVPRTAMITQALHAPGSFVLSSLRCRWRYCLNIVNLAGIGMGTTRMKYDIATWPHGDPSTSTCCHRPKGGYLVLGGPQAPGTLF